MRDGRRPDNVDRCKPIRARHGMGKRNDDREGRLHPRPAIGTVCDTWNEILQHCKVPSNHVREYLYWCKTKFKIGNKKEFKKDPEALFFPSPMGTRNRNPKFNADCKFPIAAGQAWEDHLSERAITIRKAQHSIDRALRIAESAFQEETNLSRDSR